MLNLTEYYDEFLKYFEIASWQQEDCNLGTIDYSETLWDDDLVKNVFLYDVVERRYAGFSQLLLDLWHDEDDHPYWHKANDSRKTIIKGIETSTWGLEEWLYVFFIHRLTGSGINYAKNPSGYHNSILLNFYNTKSIEDMKKVYLAHTGPKFTSSGYQIAPFPKPKAPYAKGGDYFICEILPDLVRRFADFLHGQNGTISFRETMKWLEKYNQDLGFRVFRFQYGAVLADIADFFPDFIDVNSHFFYGKNAMECLGYLAKKPKSIKPIEFYDKLVEHIMKDIGSIPYNIEDIACDFIRWVENYINPKGDYSHLDMDKIWSSCSITDHPFGRQKSMLDFGLVDTFNGKPHPSDNKILEQNWMTPSEYKDLIWGF